MKTPKHLQPGDTIAIVSPSGAINVEYIEAAKEVLKSWGLLAVEGLFARNQYFNFAGVDEERLTDLQNAINDPNIKAIMCSRGGYVLMKIIDQIDLKPLRRNPKWIIGFSDITALHNSLSKKGICSIHGSMCRHLFESELNKESIPILQKILLEDYRPTYTTAYNDYNKNGHAKGRFIGGNLSLIFALQGTPYDLDYKGNILFIEDLCEYAYHIDRMMEGLRLSGALSKIKGLVVGQFTDITNEEKFGKNVYEIIQSAMRDYDVPILFDFPAGHIDNNMPLIIGNKVELNVNIEGGSLTFL